MSNFDPADRLDALLRGCEDIVAGTVNGDMTATTRGEADETSSFIAIRLAQFRSTVSHASVGHAPAYPKVAARRAVPRDAAGRRRLLGRLIASRPELPTRISMAFKSREPEDAEIAEMLDELLRTDDGSAMG